jgi:hypothetical protein
VIVGLCSAAGAAGLDHTTTLTVKPLSVPGYGTVPSSDPGTSQPTTAPTRIVATVAPPRPSKVRVRAQPKPPTGPVSHIYTGLYDNDRGYNQPAWGGASILSGDDSAVQIAQAAMPGGNNILVMLDRTGTLRFSAYIPSGNTWTAPAVITEPSQVSAISAAGLSDGSMWLVMVVNGHVYEDMRASHGTWQGATTLTEPSPVSAISAAATPDGSLQLVMVVNGVLYHDIRRADGTWQGAQMPAEPEPVSAMAVAGMPNGDMQLVMVVNGSVYHDIRYQDTTWQGPHLYDASRRITQVSTTSSNDGGIDLIELDINGDLWHSYRSSYGTWYYSTELPDYTYQPNDEISQPRPPSRIAVATVVGGYTFELVSVG